MIDIFVHLLLGVNKILFNNLGLTIIFIGALSRVIFYPFMAHSMRYSQVMRDLKPRLDEAKKKYKGDVRKMSEEQNRIFREVGVNPAAGGAISCLGLIVQFAVFFLLFQSLTKVIASGVETRFLIWDLAKPDSFRIQSIPTSLPGFLVLLTAFLTFIQSKMMMPVVSPQTKINKGKAKKEPDFSETLTASQGTFAYFIPFLIIFWGINLAAGLTIYWLVSTVFGIIQQYYISGVGGLKPWAQKIKLVK